MFKKQIKSVIAISKSHKILTMVILFMIFFGTVSLITLNSQEEKEKDEVLSSQSKKNPTPTLTSVPSATSTSIPTPSSSPMPSTAKIEYPSQILNLTNWKLTLPTGESEHPREIEQPELNKFKEDPWFVVHENNRVRFRAPVNGVTTSGSHYPRSELREMIDNGETRAAWSATSGKHTMTIEEAITAVPSNKKHVVAGQIHDADDDVIVIRLEDRMLYVNVDGDNTVTLDSDYELGKKFKIKFEVEGGKTKVFYNDGAEPIHTLDKNYSGAYFKAGAYTQSNCQREINPFICNSDNFGEVIIYRLEVSHQ